MLTVLSINISHTFQLSKEHILLNIDCETSNPCFSCCILWMLIQAEFSLSHLNLTLVILGLSTKVTRLLLVLYSSYAGWEYLQAWDSGGSQL